MLYMLALLGFMPNLYASDLVTCWIELKEIGQWWHLEII